MFCFVQVADFGLGRAFGVPVRIYTHEVVTLWYRAPEVLLGSPRYSCPIDIWSMGCIFAEMATKKPLFQGDSEIDQLFRIFRLVLLWFRLICLYKTLIIFRVLRTPTEQLWPGVSSYPDYKATFPNWTNYNLDRYVAILDNDGIDLVKEMLVYNPSKRISAKRISVHPYLKDVDRSVRPVIKLSKN